MDRSTGYHLSDIMDGMHTVLDRLTLWRAEAVERLRSGDESALGLKLALDAALRWLAACPEDHLRSAFEVVRLPLPEDHETLGDYRILWDRETEDRQAWQEVVQASPGDLIVRFP
jgi:hypothetical protein